METGALRSLWAEPRAPDPPVRVWRDWLLVGVLLPLSLLDGVFREDLVWRIPTTLLGVALVFSLLWRRTNPLLMVLLAFGATASMNLVAIASGVRWEGLVSGAGLLLLPYALLRWGSGRDAVIGLAVVLTSMALGFIANFNEWGEVVGGSLFVLFPAALGASVRYQDNSRTRDREQVKLREREQLARELHDSVAHHVSAIVIQAQAGRALAKSRPEAADGALQVIEEAASRALDEMRSMVGALRGNGEAELAPQPGLSDIERLARGTEAGPRVSVEVVGDLGSIRPPVGAALYRLAQESITNAIRHAKGATRVDVRIEGDGESVRLTVCDDGRGAASDSGTGYGLVGMAERARLLGGRLEAGPNREQGWTVVAELPMVGAPS